MLGSVDQEALESVDVGVDFVDDDAFRGVPKVGIGLALFDFLLMGVDVEASARAARFKLETKVVLG